MAELWQLYDNQGNPIPDKGALPQDVYGKALLHAASHVWIWRRTKGGPEILLQKRNLGIHTWPGRYDISAAGHVDLDETPLAAAIRETQEEIGFTIKDSDFQFIGVDRRYVLAPDKTWTENELNWLYLFEATSEAIFSLEDGEVLSLEWKPVRDIESEVKNKATADSYVPHGQIYYGIIFAAIGRAL
jgi:8-oxo-dGTP pyrophosphatase MutT (NUDIX family)